jgi:hypothetical protein
MPAIMVSRRSTLLPVRQEITLLPVSLTWIPSSSSGVTYNVYRDGKRRTL